MEMSYLNNQKHHAARLLALALATAMLIDLYAVTSYSATRPSSFSVAETNGATIPLIQPQTPALKANGKIAFTSDRDGNPEIYVTNGDGTEQVRLTNNPGMDDSPAWSPDGRRIAFLSQKASGGYAIKLMNADGTGQGELTTISFEENCQQHCAQGLGLRWSPLGTKIAFAERVGGVEYDIFTINVDGSNRVNLTNDPAFDFEPSWSPDGSRILFVSSRDPFLTMHTMNADGSDVRALPSDGEFWDLAPDWSPRGDRIVFLVDSEYFLPGLYTANADGSNRQPFDGCGPGFCNQHRYNPMWSPDATKIVFQVEIAFSHDTQLYVKNVSGGGVTRLTNTKLRNYHPSWGPSPTTPTGCWNPIDCADSFVRQHYRDFLNREPDAPGLAFWADNITTCSNPAGRTSSQTEAECIDQQKVTTSAAFFLSPEFQYTGYFVYRLYKGSLIKNGAGRFPTYQEFLRDVRQVASGIIQNNQLSAATIEQNKKTFAEAFTQRAEFRNLYDPLSNFDYVERLFHTTGVNVSAQEKQVLVDGLNNQTETRASVLQKVVDGAVVLAEGNHQFTTPYGRAFYEKEFNAAFVQMEYFGYLQRDPDAAGYQHWLDKLNLYGNYIDAEMVRSFIASPEYRARFGQP
jgi:hypothetical protein